MTSAPLNSSDTVAPNSVTNVATINPGDTLANSVQYYNLGGTTYTNSKYQPSSQITPPNTSVPVPSSQITNGAAPNLPVNTPSNGSNALAASSAASVPVPTPSPTSSTPQTDLATTGDYSQDPGYKAANSQLQASESQLQSLQGQMPSQADLLSQNEQSTGATADLKNLNDLTATYNTAQAGYNAQYQNIEAQGVQAGVPAVFYQGEQAAQQKVAAVDLATKAIAVQNAQGNYNAAQALAEQTANLQFSDWQNKINNVTQFIQLNQNNLSQAEQLAVSKMQAQAQQDQITLNNQKANVQTALTAGVQTQFVNQNGTFFNAQTGQAYATPQDFFNAAGVTNFNDAYTKGLVTDINASTMADKQQVQAMAGAYPDAGIKASDTLQQATAKLQKSAIYRKDTYIAGVSGGGNSSGVATGATGSSTIDTTQPGYSTQIVSGTGGLTQSAIDQAALSYSLTGQLPTGSRSSTGVGLQQATAIKNRAAELNTGGNIQANKVQLGALSDSLTTQTKLLNTVQAALNAADTGGQQLISAFQNSGINDSSVTFANVIANAAKYQLSPGQISAFKAGLQEVSNSYSSVFARGSGQTNQTRSTANDILNGNISLSALQGVLSELNTQGNIVVSAQQKQIQSIQDNINKIIAPPSSNSNSGNFDAMYTPNINSQIWALAQPKGISADDLTQLSHTMSPTDLMNLIKAYNQ